MVDRLTSLDAGAATRDKINAAFAAIEAVQAALLSKADRGVLIDLQSTLASATRDLRASISAAQVAAADARAAVTGKASAGGLTALADALDSAITTLRQADTALAAAAPPSIARPADGLEAFTLVSSLSALAGEAAALAPVPASAVALNDSGAVVRVRGSAILAAREAEPVESGRIRLVRATVSRLTKPSDPSGDTVRIGVQFLDAAKNLLGFGVVSDLSTAMLSAGRQARAGYISAGALVGATITAPPGAVYFRRLVQTFGGDSVTDIEILAGEDVTGQTVPPAASADLTADVAALKSQNAGSRLAALEGQVSAPNSITFATRGDAASGAIPSTVTTVETRGRDTPGDGAGGLYRRVSSLPGGADGFTNTGGSIWQRQAPSQAVFNAEAPPLLAGLAGALPTSDPGTTGLPFYDAGSLSFSGGPYSLAERFGDLVNAMSFIPRGLRSAIRAGTSTVDVTNYLRNALASGINVYLPRGRYRITDMLTLQQGQSLLGAGVMSSILFVDGGFNLSASAIVSVGVSDSSGWDGVGIECDQTGVTTRSGLRQYPWALDIRVATRFKIGRFRVSKGWRGIRGDGNCGGLDAGLLELGCFDKGLILDGLLDFAHIGSLHIWCFSFPGDAALLAVYRDGQTIGAEFGACDGLDIKSLNNFATRVIGNANGNDGAARQIGMVQLDGDRSSFEGAAGDWQIGILSSTKTGAFTDPAVRFDGGVTTVGTARLWGAVSGSYLKVNGGNVVVSGGTFEQLADYPAAEVTGGALMLGPVGLRPQQNSVRTRPHIQQTGTGRLVVNGATALTTGSGPLIGIAVDRPDHKISNVDFNNWGYSLPAGARLGQYGPNKSAPFTWQPTIKATNPGNMAPSFSVQTGRYWYEDDGIHFEGRLVGAMNAYSGASGRLSITGLPALPLGGVDNRPVALGEIGGLLIPNGGVGIVAVLSQATGNIDLMSYSTTGALTYLDPAALPPGSPFISISFSGLIPAR